MMAFTQEQHAMSKAAPVSNAALVSLATSLPPNVFLQKDVLTAAWEVFGPRFPEFEMLSSIFTNTGIVKRHGVKPFDWYLERRGWPERTEAFLAGAEELFVDAAQKGLAIAARLAQARPGTNVLLVAVELCSLALRLDELTKANIVATSLFGDGAAAIILRAGDGGATTIENSGEHLWPDTLGIMGWNVDPEGFGVIFQRTIPDFVTAHLNPAVVQILANMQLTTADIDRFICHPGGARVITALETALTLHQGTLDHERQVISDCGNMSAPTVLFVLEHARNAGLPQRSLLTALGPGFTASCVALRHAA